MNAKYIDFSARRLLYAIAYKYIPTQGKALNTCNRDIFSLIPNLMQHSALKKYYYKNRNTIFYLGSI